MPPRPWPKPVQVTDCKDCGHRHGARCQYLLGKEGNETHVCGCEGAEQTKKRIPVPSPGVGQLM
jgi:hypothetical protein